MIVLAPGYLARLLLITALIQQDKFHAQFAADVSDADAKLRAGTQRAVRKAAFNEAAGTPARKSTVLVHLWQPRLEHSGGGPLIHGEARRLEGDGRRSGCIARGDGFSLRTPWRKLIEHAAAAN